MANELLTIESLDVIKEYVKENSNFVTNGLYVFSPSQNLKQDNYYKLDTINYNNGTFSYTNGWLKYYESNSKYNTKYNNTANNNFVDFVTSTSDMYTLYRDERFIKEVGKKLIISFPEYSISNLKNLYKNYNIRITTIHNYDPLSTYYEYEYEDCNGVYTDLYEYQDYSTVFEDVGNFKGDAAQAFITDSVKSSYFYDNNVYFSFNLKIDVNHIKDGNENIYFEIESIDEKKNRKYGRKYADGRAEETYTITEYNLVSIEPCLTSNGNKIDLKTITTDETNKMLSVDGVGVKTEYYIPNYNTNSKSINFAKAYALGKDPESSLSAYGRSLADYQTIKYFSNGIHEYISDTFGRVIKLKYEEFENGSNINDVVIYFEDGRQDAFSNGQYGTEYDEDDNNQDIPLGAGSDGINWYTGYNFNGLPKTGTYFVFGLNDKIAADSEFDPPVKFFNLYGRTDCGEASFLRYENKYGVDPKVLFLDSYKKFKLEIINDGNTNKFTYTIVPENGPIIYEVSALPYDASQYYNTLYLIKED